MYGAASISFRPGCRSAALGRPTRSLAINTLIADRQGRYQICGYNAFNRYGYDDQLPNRIYADNNRISGDRAIAALNLTLIKVADERLGETERRRPSTASLRSTRRAPGRFSTRSTIGPGSAACRVLMTGFGPISAPSGSGRPNSFASRSATATSAPSGGPARGSIARENSVICTPPMSSWATEVTSRSSVTWCASTAS